VGPRTERVHAEDIIGQARDVGMVGQLPPSPYGEGIKFTITWLLGDRTAPPTDSAGRGPYCQGRKLPATLRTAQVTQRGP
jgi:hypothetical protein